MKRIVYLLFVFIILSLSANAQQAKPIKKKGVEISQLNPKTLGGAVIEYNQTFTNKGITLIVKKCTQNSSIEVTLRNVLGRERDSSDKATLRVGQKITVGKGDIPKGQYLLNVKVVSGQEEHLTTVRVTKWGA